MYRCHPTTKLGVTGHLGRPITRYNSIGEYIVSKENEEHFKKAINEDDTTESFESLYAKRVQEYEIALAMQKEVLQLNEEKKKLDCLRVEEVRRDQERLRQRFFEVTKILKASREKETRAENSLHDELTEQNECRRKSAATRKNIQVLKEFSIQMKNTVREYGCYEELLKKFLRENPHYENVDNFINCTDALLMSCSDIEKHKMELMHKLDESRNELVELVRRQASILMQNKNELDFFVRAYMTARNEALMAEEQFRKIKMTHSRHMVDRNAMYDGLYNLYLLLCKRRMIEPTLRYHEVHKISMFIKGEFEVLRGVAINLENLKCF
ncbi:uncharacterized protein LOC119682538 [Teleopsis dalmanni]|uniref:uncharacterized protein LOC119681751 n=1 Tax=Teleopsis dalmanni TaxID=139649 RepID=UPI0018CCB259|nr:uncharacterized protein LOC119681751 [Teleopsis dalmanni]XP_037950967.1 uncharacterized protein LOC119681763 [Teleopsis dalmanni]XP_037951391.1 uncharacterized protein LOC119682107 [Teleopsis dalmanni]XP_037951930.1 uncharacterized protein LOC119682538 [Teleopsis dalmanni]